MEEVIQSLAKAEDQALEDALDKLEEGIGRAPERLGRTQLAAKAMVSHLIQ